MNTTLLRFCRVPRLRFASLGGLLLTALLLAVAPPAVAQTVDLLLRGGGTILDEGRATATDAAGNVYVTGSFQGTATIGGTQLISAGGRDIFVARYNASGVLQWVQRAGGIGDDRGYGIAVDAGGVYVTGFFQGTANFNPPASNTLVSAGGFDIFVAKYNSSGTVQWLRRAGGIGFDYGLSIAVDAGGVYVTGSFAGTANFNTPATSNTLVSAGNDDIFVANYDASGAVQWLRRAGGIGFDYGVSIAVDAGGVYVTGNFSGTANFNTPANPASNTLVSAVGSDIFVANYDASGTVQWLRRAGGIGFDSGLSIAVDAGGVYVTGRFQSTADFNTPATSNTLVSAGGDDIFVANYDASGAVQWLRRAGGSLDDVGTGIAVDAGGVYVTGTFAGTANFNTPSASGTNELTSAGSTDIFVTRYNSAGVSQWLRRAGGSGLDSGYGITSNANGVYVTGVFQNTANFNTPSATGTNELTSAGVDDLFLVRFTLAPTIAGFAPTAATVCAGNVATFTATVGNVTGAYDFTLTNGTSTTTGTQSAATFSQPWTAAGSGTQSFTLRVSDNSSLTTATTTLTVSSLPTATLTASHGGTLTCARTSLTLTATGGTSYTFSGPGVVSQNATAGTAVVNQSGTYSVTVANAAGCRSTTTVGVVSNTAVVTVGNPATTTAQAGVLFSQSFTTTGGSSPYTYSLNSGSLPTGLTLTAAGSLSGTPTQTGTFNLVVRGTDANGCSDLSNTYALTVLATAITSFTVTPTTVCVGGQVTFSALVGNVTGAYDFTLTNGTSPVSGTATGATFSQTLTASGSGVQTYSLIVSDNSSTTFASTTLTVDTHPDYQALVDLYNSTNGPGWTTRTGWLNGCNPCTGNGGSPWFRVTCTNGRVTQLQLNGNQLSGSIPNSLSALTNLQLLQLGGNNLSGPIPDGISSLTNLQLLSLFSNQLSGPIPDGISSLTNLQLLQLFSNQLTGNIPSSLSALTNLTQLQLGNNQLSGSIPTGLSSLTNLTGLDLRDNQLSGCYPASLTVFCGITTAFRTNTALPGGGSAASFSALCSSGAGSDAFVAAASAGQTTALVGSVLSLSVTGGSTASFSWLAPAGATLGTPTTTSAIAATLTTAGVKTFTVTVSFGSSCTSTATVSVTGIPTCVSSFTVDDLGEGADASPGDGICATSGGVCTLRAAMEEVTALNCPGPYTITVGVSGTINLTSVLPDIVDDVTFLGPGAANLTVRRSSGFFRIFTIPNSNTVSFSGFAIADGQTSSGGGGISNRGNLTLTNCVVRDNVTTSGNGGGIDNRGQLTLTNTSISSNTAASLGGGLYSNGGSSTLTSCSFVTNRSTTGGGGIYNTNHTATLTNCVLQSNTAVSGGGLFNSQGSSTLTSCSLTNNWAVGNRGGAISNVSGHRAVLTNCVLQNNTAGNGDGGGLLSDSGSSTLTSCSLTGNRATSAGGAIRMINSHTATLTNCVLQSNTAVSGGGLNSNGSSSTILNGSFEGNVASEGGAVYVSSGTPHVLTNVSFRGNSAPTGTVCYINSATVQLTNGVLFGNGAPGNAIANGTLQATSSLFEQNTSGFTADPSNLTTSVSPFANPTGTQLNACTPAIDAGSNAAFTALTGTPAGADLAGNPRFFDGGTGTPARIDMGAQEFQGVGGPVASFSVLGSGTATCAQSPTITMSGSQTGVDYQLQRDGINTGGAVAGTGAALSFGPQSLSGVYSVLATNPTSSCTALMAQSATVVSNAEVPSLTVTATPSLTVTTGNTATLTASGASSYSWSSGENTAVISVSVAGTYSVTGITGSCRSVSSVVLTVSAPPCGTVIYVTQNGAGLQNGTSWDNALNSNQLQLAITTAASCSAQVWVAAGTYKPTTTTGPASRTISFAMRNNVAIYGGFVGSETALSGRTLTSPSTTTLSGEIGDPSSTTDNSYHVISNPQGLTTTAVLDGFVITGGRAYGAGNTSGGGMYNNGSGAGRVCNPLIRNCIFQNNTASDYGGAMYNNGASSGNSSPSLTNCSFQNNTASSFGGAMYNDGDFSGNSNPSLTNCSFQNNTAPLGGGMYNFNSSPTLTNCTFQNNTASNGGGMSNGNSRPTLTNCAFQNNAAIDGGGMYNSNSSPTLINCAFQNNAASDIGGGMVNIDSNPTLTNCTFQNNAASNNGGGMLNGGSNPRLTNCTFQNNTASNGGGMTNSFGNPTLTNCILWGNNSQIANLSSSNPTVTYCLVQGGYPGTGNLNADPLFVDAPNGNLSLQTCSPAINTGDPNSVTAASGPYSATALPPTDLAGQARIVGSRVDMGAFEFQGVGGPPLSFSVLGSGTATCAQSPTITLSGSQTGVGYQLQRDGVNTGGAVAGTGAALSFGPQSLSGVYSVLATNTTSSCTALMAQSATVVSSAEVPSLTVTASNGGTLTCAVTSLTLTATSSATALRWTGGSTGATLPVSASGTYSVTATGANGCSVVSNAVTITQDVATPANASLTASNSGTLTCSITALTLTASATGGAGLPASLSYVFAGSTGTLAGSGNTRTVSVSGLYSVTITGANGCTASQTTTVVSNTTAPTLSVTPTSATLTCAVTSLTLTASGNATGYRWTGGSTSNTLAVNVANTYSVTATAANGCTSTTSVVVSQSAGLPTAGLVASGTLTCAQTSVTLTASGGNAYAFGGPGMVGQNAASGTAVVNAGGLYSVTVTNTATGCSSVTTVTVQSNTASPSVSIAPISGTLTCAVTSLTLTATSSATALLWTGGSTGATLPVSASGTYSVTATGANGCTAVSNAVTITQSVATPTLSVTPTSGTLTCANPSVTLTATTSATGLRWNTNQITPSIVVSTSGTYSVTATAANGCTSSTNVTVNTDLGGSSPVPTLSASASVVCAGANVIVVATVGGSPSGLQWYKNPAGAGQAPQAVSGQTSATLSLGGVQVAQAGSYVLVVTGGCSVTSSAFTLTVNPLPTVTLSFPTGTTVIGPGTGTATITLPDPLPAGFDLSFGAFGAVFYERTMVIDRINGYEIRSVDSSTGRFPITQPGPFTITATDANGCRQTVQGVITNLPVLGR